MKNMDGRVTVFPDSDRWLTDYITDYVTDDNFKWIWNLLRSTNTKTNTFDKRVLLMKNIDNDYIYYIYNIKYFFFLFKELDVICDFLDLLWHFWSLILVLKNEK